MFFVCVLFLAGAGLWTFGVIRVRGEPSLSSSWIGWFAGLATLAAAVLWSLVLFLQ